jgi:hypothetical protein
MSTYLKPTETKKSKNNTYQNSSNNYNSNLPSKNSKLSFSNALKNNTHKKTYVSGNSAKKRPSKKHNINNNTEKENNIPNKISNNKRIDYNQENNSNSMNFNDEDIKDQKMDKMNFKNEDDDEDKYNKRVLCNADSYQSLGFLLPKKMNIEKSAKKIMSKNRRYLNQEAYDYDGNIYNNFDSSNKKKYKDTDDSVEDEINNRNEDNNELSYNEDDLDKLKKKEELIKKLMKYKNYQNFVKKILKKTKFGYNKKGKLLKWSKFKKNLYNIKFLDLYYQHRLPFIIMRPRLDVIRRKREERQRREKLKMEEELKYNNLKGSNLKSSIEIKEGETTYASILDKNIQNEMEKNGYIIGEDNNTVRIEKRESLFPSKDGKPKGIFTLTKIPQKTDENSGNIRLKMAFNKAKDAARVVRRLEYSYSMRVNILLSKPIFQKNAKIIQNWYRSMKFIKINTPKIVKIQAFVRGMMIRKAFREVRRLYEQDLPFIKEIDKIISRRFARLFFEKLIPRFAIRTLIKLTKIKNDKIINALSKFRKKQIYIRENFSLSTKLNKKCVYTKETYDYLTKIKLLKLQSHVKLYLMHNNQKLLLKYTNEYHPKLYYYLKYMNDKDLLKKKLKKFREYLLKLKELKLKTKYKDKNIKIYNKYDYLKYLLRKIIFSKLKSYYNDSINNKDINYQKKMKLKILLNHQKINNNKRVLKHYLNKWNIIANYLEEYRRILKHDKLLLIETILKYHKKFREKVFLFLLNSIKENKIKEEKTSLNKMISFYDKHNKIHDKEHINNVLLRAIKIWRKNSKLISLLKASNTINRNAKIFLCKKKLKQKQKLLNCLNIRNKIFKEKLRLWKFNAGKLKHHYNSFINKTLAIIKMKQKIKILKKDFVSLEKRKKNILKKYFDRFQTNTGVKKLLYINLQLCLYDENKKPIIDDKYSVMKYIKAENDNINKDELKNEMTLEAIFNFWQAKQKMVEFKKKCGRRIRMKCEMDKNMLKLKFIHWYKINKIKKAENACKIIQRKYRKYKKEKAKN